MKRTEALSVLGLPPTATLSEIRAAHIALAWKWHPDRFGTDPDRRADAEERLKDINVAYQALLAEQRESAAPARGEGSARQPAQHEMRERVITRERHPHTPPPRHHHGTPAANPTPGLWSRMPGTRRGAMLAVGLLLSVALFLTRGRKDDSAAESLALPESTTARTSGGQARPGEGEGTAVRSAAPRAGARGSRPAAPLSQARSPTTALSLDHPQGSPTDGPLSLTPAERQAIEAVCLDAKLTGGTAAYSRCRANELARLAAGPGRPDLRSLSLEDRGAVESACLRARLNEGGAGYNRCLAAQLAQLREAPARPDLSRLGSEERDAILSACSEIKADEGPAAYNHCLMEQVTALGQAPARPDLSRLTSEERDGVEAACAQTRQHEGAAAYNRCLAEEVAQLAQNRSQVDLGGLTSEQRDSVEAACQHARITEGAAAYDRCLVERISRLGVEK